MRRSEFGERYSRHGELILEIEIMTEKCMERGRNFPQDSININKKRLRGGCVALSVLSLRISLPATLTARAEK